MTVAKRVCKQEADAPFLFFNLRPDKSDFERDVIEGLSQECKTLPPKYFYDVKGSLLFEQICDTEEYYVTRTERRLLETVANEIAELAGPASTVIEYGSGACVKVRTLLDALDRPYAYVAIDLSEEQLLSAAHAIAGDYPNLQVTALCADFVSPFELPQGVALGTGIRLGFFPGSTIGNLTPSEAYRFLDGARRLLAPHGALVVGIDLKKNVDILNAAYNDAAGITASFNRNILERMKRELGASVDVEAFEHHAFYHAEKSRIEMHLRAKEDVAILVGDRRFELKAGDTIHTENSYKHDLSEFATLAERAGFVARAAWTDPNRFFAVLYLSANRAA